MVNMIHGKSQTAKSKNKVVDQKQNKTKNKQTKKKDVTWVKSFTE